MKNTKLPENWVIDTEKEKNSPIMPKFMEWFKENQTAFDWNDKYLGKYDGYVSSFSPQENTPIITLEQWHEAYFPEWQPKQGELILVKDYEIHEWEERIFAVNYKGRYFTEKSNEDNEVLLGWKFAKPIPKESQLQPKIDELKAEAEKLGLKIEIIIS